MQESAITPTWLQLALGFIATFVAGGAGYKYLNTWLNRKKPAADVHLTHETAAEIRVRAGSTAGDAIIRFMDRLDHAQITIDRLRAERDAWQDEYDKVFVSRDQLMAEVGKLRSELELYDEEMKRMRATLTLENKNYDNTKQTPVQPWSESDQPKE